MDQFGAGYLALRDLAQDLQMRSKALQKGMSIAGMWQPAVLSRPFCFAEWPIVIGM